MLTVLSVGYSLAPVGPDAVGGSEQVLSALDTALVAKGYRSIVIAAEGSEAAGELIKAAPALTDPIRGSTAFRRPRTPHVRRARACCRRLRTGLRSNDSVNRPTRGVASR